MFAHATPVSNKPDEFYVAFPKVIRSGGNTTVWIYHKSKSSSVDCLFNGTIKLSQDYDNYFIPTTYFSLSRDSTKKLQVTILCSHETDLNICRILQLSLPDTVRGRAKIQVKIMHPNKGEVFTRGTVIKVQPVERLVFIQTEKPMYKLGDRVRFRIMSVRMDTLTESSEVRGTARGVDAPVYYSKVVVKKPSRRAMAAWINKTWEQGFEVNLLECSVHLPSGRGSTSSDLPSKGPSATSI